MIKFLHSIKFLTLLCILFFLQNVKAQIVYQDLTTNTSYTGDYNITTKNGASDNSIVTYSNSETGMGLNFGVNITNAGDSMEFTTAEYEIFLNANLTIKSSTTNSIEFADRITTATAINTSLIPDADVQSMANKDKMYMLEIKKTSPATNTNNFWGQESVLAFRYMSGTNSYYGWLEFRLDRLTVGTKEVGFKIQLLRIAYSTSVLNTSETGLETIKSFNISMQNIYKDMDSSNNVKFTIPHKTTGTYTMSINKLPAETPDTFTVAVTDTSVLTYNNGLIETKRNGNTDITITAASGLAVTVKMVVRIVAVTDLNIVTVQTNAPLTITQKKGSLALKIVPTPLNANQIDIEWSVIPNPNVQASINTITGVLAATAGNGPIVIKATQKDNTIPQDTRVSKSVTINISNQDPIPVLVESITLNLPQLGDDLKLNVGATTQLTATVNPTNADTKTVGYNSLSSDICTVNQNGLITGVAPGNCQIRVSSQDGSSVTQDTQTILIERVAAAGNLKDFSWNLLTSILYVGETVGVVALFTPSNANNKTLTWTSGNTNVIKVTNEKNINEVTLTAVGSGTAVITATSTDGTDISKPTNINVRAKKSTFIPLKDFSISPNIVSIVVGARINLSPIVNPYNATNQNVKWESSDTEILSITQNKVALEDTTPRQAIGTALKTGIVMITATSLENQDVIRTITITINQGTTVTTQNLELTYPLNNGKTSVLIGDVLQPNLQITPNNTSNKKILFTSSNPTVATVDQKGVVTALALGTTVISAFVTDGSVDNSGGRVKTSLEMAVVKSTGLQVTGINNNSINDTKINIYPNPIKNHFIIDPKNDIQYPINTEILTLQGTSIWKKNIRTKAKKIIIDEKLPAGVYILKIYNDQPINYSTKIHIE